MNSTFAQASVAQQQRLDDYFHLFSITFLYWDHLITFPEELRYLWKRPMRATTVLFFCNRYFAVLGNAAVTVSLFSSGLPELSCQPFHVFRDVLLVLTQVLVCVLLTIRIYALYNRSTRMLALMLTVGLTSAGLATFSAFFGQSAPELSPTGGGCHTQLSFITFIEVTAAWEALFLYHLMIFLLTLNKAYKARHQLQQKYFGVMSMFAIMLRDGSVYFGLMAFSNLINISTFYYPEAYLRGGLCTFASSMSVTLMSRLMLNLHQIADTGLYTSHNNTC